MVDLAVLQTASYLIAALSFAVTCAYYIINLNNNKKNQQTTLETRQAQLFMQIYSRFSDKDFIAAISHVVYNNPPVYKDFDEYQEKYIEKNPEYDQMVKQIIFTFEGVGVLVSRGLIDVSYVDDLFSSVVISFWESIRPSIVECRTRFNMPQIDEWVEYLYDRIRVVAEEQHPELNSGIRRVN